MSNPITIPVIAPEAMAWYELNDLGNAKRIADLAQGKLLWVEDHWSAFDGRRWSAEDGARLAQRLAHDMARHIPAEADALEAQSEAAAKEMDKAKAEMFAERASALRKHGVTSGNANKTVAALSQLKSEVPAQRDDFDRDPLAINCANGTLRFVKSGEGRWISKLMPHDPSNRISRITETKWDEKAECPKWDAHMATVLPREDVRDFFQAIMGYAATGSIIEQCILLLQGKGGDGKSTTIDVIRETLGLYARTSSVESFLHGAVRSGAEASPDMARLAGDTRMVSTSEPRIGAALDEGRIKQITGGQPVNARELHGAPFEYIPRFLLVLECNRKPRISGDDDGIWRRVVVIEFPHQFKGAAANKLITHQLLKEAPGVLRWLVDGALRWLNDGLVAPQSVLDTVEDYRRASNPFGDWFADYVDTSDPDHREWSADLYNSYTTYCDDNGVDERTKMSSTAFGRALGDKQLRRHKGGGGKIQRIGARLREAHEMVKPDGGATDEAVAAAAAAGAGMGAGSTAHDDAGGRPAGDWSAPPFDGDAGGTYFDD